MATVYELKSWLTAVDAEKPGGDHAGREIVCTDSGKKYRWSGLAWVQLGGPHAAMHASGAADQLDVDDLGGFPGGTTNFLRADGTFAAPPAGGTPPTGTGFRHITGGVEDAASKFVETADVTDAQITYAKIQDVSAISKLLGRGSAAGAGDVQEITLGTNLSMAGTTLNAAGGGGSATTVEVDIGATAVFRGKFTITDAAITGTSKVLCWQAPGPYTGKGTLADEAEMQPVSVIAVEPATGSAVVKWQTPPMVALVRQTTSTNLRAAGATFDRLANQQAPEEYVPTRIGRVRGNVKFSYMVM